MIVYVQMYVYMWLKMFLTNGRNFNSALTVCVKIDDAMIIKYMAHNTIIIYYIVVYANEWTVGELLTPTELSNTLQYQQLLWRRVREGQRMIREKPQHQQLLLLQQLQQSQEENNQLQQQLHQVRQESREDNRQLRDENCQLKQQIHQLQQQSQQQLRQVRQELRQVH